MKEKAEKPWMKNLEGIDFSDPDNALKDPQNMERLKEIVKDRLVNKGEEIKDVLEVPSDVINYIYDIGYASYNQGNIVNASRLFLMLALIDSTNYKYSFAIAACLHRLKEYELACEIYNNTSKLNPNFPLAFYHIADCRIQLNQKNEAKEALNKAFELCGDIKEYGKLKEEVELMRERL